MRKYLIIIVLFGIFITNLRFYNMCNAKGFSINEYSSAESMVVMERSSNRILYSKNEDKILPMASTTKILTAIVAIEKCKNLDEKHIITKDMTGIEGSSIYLKEGESLSIRELLYGLMLRSGNDSAVAIAKIISGSIENFVKEMNSLCVKLGLLNTNIVTVNGLHDKNHYTTASDLAKISCYALTNSVFQEVVKTKQTKISNDLDEKNKCRLLKNKNKLLKIFSGADGVKTGYTTKAGRCFVGSATRNNMQVVCVVLNCKDMFEECERLIDKAFDEYSLELVQSQGNLNYSNDNNNLNIIFKNDIFLPLKNGEKGKVKSELQIFEKPLHDGQIGFENFLIENNLIFSEKIYTIIDEKNEKTENLKDKFYKVIRAF